MEKYNKKSRSLYRDSLNASKWSKFSQFFSLDNNNSPGYVNNSNLQKQNWSESNSSIYKKPLITSWRRADHDDLRGIELLIESNGKVIETLFRKTSLSHMIEKATFAMVQLDNNKNIISFIALFPYPNIPAVPSFLWFDWLKNSYKIEGMCPHNILFVHYMVWNPDISTEFVRLTLETIFMEFVHLKNIIIVRPPLAKTHDIYSEFFVQVLPIMMNDLESSSSSSVQSLLLCVRSSVVTRMRIRKAMMEDHDDLMPLIDKQCPKLRVLYGDYFMAELAGYPGTPDRYVLTCEMNGDAVGIMSLNRAVDLTMLNEQFELGAFHGMRKPSDEDSEVANVSIRSSNEFVPLPTEIDSELDKITSNMLIKIFDWKPSFEWKPATNDLNKLTQVYSLRHLEFLSLLRRFTKELLDSEFIEDQSEKKEKMYLDEKNEDTGCLVSRRSSLISLPLFNLPIYRGEPNAFAIELYAMNDEIFDERQSFDFLEAAFEAFPNLDYCVLSLPSQHPTFPLLQYFVRVTPRPWKRLNQELYICHKSSIMVSFFRVRFAEKYDMKEIKSLLTGVSQYDAIVDDIVDSCYNEDSIYKTLVFVSVNTIVGVSVVCYESCLDYMPFHYNLKQLTDFDLHPIENHGVLKHFLLSPIFQNHARFFLRDIMRMSAITSLYYIRYQPEEMNLKSSLITALGELVPVLPRQRKQHHIPTLHPYLPPEHLVVYETPFALYHINSALCALTKYSTNINLVIVGAGVTSFSFLETLIFGPSCTYLTYNNITWISPDGIGNDVITHDARDIMFSLNEKFTRRYKAKLSLESYVNFVYGSMTDINRKERYVVINNKAVIRYDYLVLTCGLQFQSPEPQVLIKDQDTCRRNYRQKSSLFKFIRPKIQNRTKTKSCPKNVFPINSEVDATKAFIALHYFMQKLNKFSPEARIIVYGHTLHAYLCIQSLLKFGVPGQLIAFVEPFPQHGRSYSLFNDEQIDQAVLNQIQELKIDHYKSYVLYDWHKSDKNRIISAKFQSETDIVDIFCIAMFPFHKKEVSEATFNAINRANLVFDGKLIIDNHFRTNDKFIYAAGPITKYKRNYFSENKQHVYYNSTEIGAKLAAIIRKKIDPTIEYDFDTEDKKDLGTNLNLVEPVVKLGQLPGDWNYFDLEEPGPVVCEEIQLNVNNHYGQILTTGDCQMTNGYGYFKLRINEYGFVVGIKCFTKDVIDNINLRRLYEKHERLLNNLLKRFSLGLIDDFYHYFRQAWAMPIVHERFPELLNVNRNMFRDEPVLADGKTVEQRVEDALKENDWKKLSDSKFSELLEEYTTSRLASDIRDNFSEFLEADLDSLPMLVSKNMISKFRSDRNASPLHKISAEDDGQLSLI